MLDKKLRGGKIADGTGGPLRDGDIGIRNGRIVEIGSIEESALETIELDGLIVAPGFIDIHTHYDAQAFWDSTLSPSPLHGVTSLIGGNCGFSIAPLEPSQGDYMMRMLARVEGMPLASLQNGVPWDWQSTAEYLNCLDHKVAPNVGFLVGHSALRRVAMHERAMTSTATPEETRHMQSMLADGLAAGALGFSSTLSRTHNDHNGDPVPSRHATREEILSLCATVRKFPGTSLEFIPAPVPLSEEDFELMGAMSRTANRPLNWNVLQVFADNTEAVAHHLAGGDQARTHGGRVVALTLPSTILTRMNFLSGFVLDMLPGWNRLVALPAKEKLRMLADPGERQEWNRLANSSTEGSIPSIANWGSYVVEETWTPGNKRYEGLSIDVIASIRGTSTWDALADLLVADDLRTVIMRKGIMYQDQGDEEETWRKRVDVWRDHRAIVGGSDAGAHLDMIDSYSYATTLLGEAVRTRGLLPIEEAISMLTAAPADLYGLVDRGRITRGAWADLVVLDPDSIGALPVRTKYDLPGGAGRLYGGAQGIARVLVAGCEIVVDGEFTESRPGRVLRSGTDTRTVTAAPVD